MLINLSSHSGLPAQLSRLFVMDKRKDASISIADKLCCRTCICFPCCWSVHPCIRLIHQINKGRFSFLQGVIDLTGNIVAVCDATFSPRKGDGFKIFLMLESCSRLSPSNHRRGKVWGRGAQPLSVCDLPCSQHCLPCKAEAHSAVDMFQECSHHVFTVSLS